VNDELKAGRKRLSRNRSIIRGFGCDR